MLEKLPKPWLVPVVAGLIGLIIVGIVWTQGVRYGARGVKLAWAKADAVERTDDARQRAAWDEEKEWLTRKAAARAVAVVRADQGTLTEEAKPVETIRTVYRTIRERAWGIPLRVDGTLPADGLRLWNAANAGHLSAAAVSHAAAALPDRPPATPAARP